jgi:serine/threonine protein kinase
MVTETWSAKITDFGVAKIASQQMTRTDVLLGTPTYMSPEQIEGKPLDGRSDQFTLGAIAYELITGEKPFAAETVASLLFKIVQEQPVHVNRLNPTVTEGVSAAIERAMSKAAADRFPTCEEFALALTEALRRAPDWKPQPRGAAATLPTVSTDHPAPSVLASPPPAKFSRRPLPDESSASLPKAVPAKAGSGRWVALVAVIALSAAAGVLGVTYWNRDQPETPPVVQREPEQAAAKAPPPRQTPALEKPSPVAPPREQPETRTAPRQTVTRPAQDSQIPAEVRPVTITSTPPGAAVTVDQSNETCRTPCALALPAGRRILRFNLAGYRPGIAILNVPEETTASARLDAVTGTVVVKTTPPGAEIYINGKLYERRSNCIINLPAGKYGFEFRQPNEKGISQDIEVKDSVTQTVEVSWQ